MSDIPAARRIIADVRNALRDLNQPVFVEQLTDALDLLTRRSAVRRMRVKSPPITSEMKQAIILRAETTDLHTVEIAVELGVNPGRVSEVLQCHARRNR
jgi:hypothetical protein